MTMEDFDAPPSPAPVKRFGPLRALMIFGAYVVVQLLVGFVVGLLVGGFETFQAIRQHQHINKAEMISKLQNATLLPIGVLSIVMAAAAVFFLARRYFPGDLKAGAMAELGWKPCARKYIIISALAGALITVFNLIVVIPQFPPDSQSFLGPVASAANTSGFNRMIWSFLAVALAPPTEEFLFRGVLYSGFLRRWSANVSALVTTVLFVSMHIPEVWGYRPALIGIGLLAGGTIVARQRTDSLVAPVALHMSYNGVLIVLAHLVLK